MKKILFLIISVLLLTTISITSFAHSGRTDSNGGHRDNINGGYHYHHGYPAHQHPDDECPYLTSKEEKKTENSKKIKILLLCTTPLMGLFIAALFIFIFNGLLSFLEDKYDFFKTHFDYIIKILYILFYIIGIILWIFLVSL